LFTPLTKGIVKNQTSESLCDLQLTDFTLLELDSVDLGEIFLSELSNSKLRPEQKLELKQRAKNFLIELFAGFQLRMKGTLGMMKKLSIFSTSIFKDTSISNASFPAPFFPQDKVNLSEIEFLAKKVQRMKIDIADTNGFWIHVHNMKDPAGDYPFHPLTNHILKILCLPLSNAEVERVFSHVSLQKNKLRNRMKTELLEATLYCKFGLLKNQMSVQDFKPPQSLLTYPYNLYG